MEDQTELPQSLMCFNTFKSLGYKYQRGTSTNWREWAIPPFSNRKTYSIYTEGIPNRSRSIYMTTAKREVPTLPHHDGNVSLNTETCPSYGYQAFPGSTEF